MITISIKLIMIRVMSVAAAKAEVTQIAPECWSPEPLHVRPLIIIIIIIIIITIISIITIIIIVVIDIVTVIVIAIIIVVSICACRFPKDSDSLGVPTKILDVVANPLQ